MPKSGAGRRMLIFFAGLATALAGVQVHLIGPEGGMTAPIVSALISIALAGALVASAVVVPKAKQGAATKPEGFEVRHAVGLGPPARDAGGLRDTQVDEYFAGIRGELGQVDQLVGDAVGNLVASFKYIDKLTRSQQEISLAIAHAANCSRVEDGGPLGRLLEQQAANADHIEQEVDAAVTSLQFGDLVAQLLRHTIIRVEALGTALQRLDWEDAGHEGGEPARKRRGSHEGIGRAVMAANAGTRRKPVVQQGMQKGGIELF